QVEPAVAEAQLLVDVLLVELERQRRRGREDVELRDLQLDLARRDVRVDRLGRALDDLAGRADDELVADAVRDPGGLGGALGVDHELADPALVAEVDEDQAAVVAAAGDPAGERHGRARLLRAQVAGVLGAPGLAHRAVSLATSSSSATTTSASPARRIVASAARAITVVRAPERDAWVS